MILNIRDDIKKVYIREGQCRLLGESEWNLHYANKEYGFGGDGQHNLKPYLSDNKFRMSGRSTGHFGSGTYFSTYKDDKKSQEVLNGSMGNDDPNFIKIADRVYRVDFDLYKNLYRVRSERQGDILYTMMINLNRFYNRICRDLGEFNSNLAIYDNAYIYQIIRKNAEGLGLKCPSYYELTRMAQSHGRNKDAIQSFSTLFMEWNGYNGVNVSGIKEYDNTTHGSVIYDLSKVNTDMEEVSPKRMYIGIDSASNTNSIVSDGYFDTLHDSLVGKDYMFSDKLCKMPIPQAMRLLKNYTETGNILNPFAIKKLGDELGKRYLRLVYVKRPCMDWYKPISRKMFYGDESKYYCRLIDEYGAYYWVNYYDKDSSNYRGYVSGLRELLYNKDFKWWDYDTYEDGVAAKKEYLNMLMSYMQRDLTDEERDYIKYDYLYDPSDDEDNVNEGRILGEAKTPPPLHWFVGNVYKGEYDMKIYEKMRMRDSSRHLAKYVNWFPLSDEDKQSLYDCMVTRYEYLLTCIANTAQIGRSIMGGMFDDDIANKDYSWFEQTAESEPLDKEFIKEYIEMRIAIGKRRKLFYGLPGRISWVTGFNPLTRLGLIPMGILKGRR